MKITVGIPTKNRYDTLSHTLLSIAFQTFKPIEVIIVDDSETPTDIRTISTYSYVLRLLDDKGIKWKVLFGQKKGQHFSHQLIQEIAEGDFIFRIDDDEMAEPNCLENLKSYFEPHDIQYPYDHEDVGAVAPLVLMPNATLLPDGLKNDISNLNQPNVQWFKRRKEQWLPETAEHLYSCFLYRKNIAKYELSLSNKAHREETLFSHSIQRNGYKLLVDTTATVWHWRQESGGIRSDNNVGDYEHDEKIFQGYLNLWGVNSEKTNILVLDNGIGDHYAFKSILPELRKKYGKFTLAACFPDVFYDENDLTLISIEQAKQMMNIDSQNIYKNMIDWNWKGTLVDAFKKLYL